MAVWKAQNLATPKIMRVDGSAAIMTSRAIFESAPANADTVEFPLPAGAHLTDLDFQWSAGFGTIAGKIGYRPRSSQSAITPVDDYFQAAGAFVTAAAGRVRCNFMPMQFDEDMVIVATLTSGPSAYAASPIPAIVMIAKYGMVGPA